MQIASRLCKLQVKLLFINIRPLLRSHSSGGFEGAEESALGGKAGLVADVGNLYFVSLAKQFFGVLNTIIIDELVERTSFLRVDAGRNGVAMHSKRISHIANFQILVKINLLCLHQLDDASHKLVGGDFRFGAVPAACRIPLPLHKRGLSSRCQVNKHVLPFCQR